MIIYITKVIIFFVNKAAKWLKEKRGRFSFRELGEDVGLSHMTLSNAEEGDATAETWIRLAEHFGESPAVVLFWAGKIKDLPRDESVIEVAHLVDGIKNETVKKSVLSMIRAAAEQNRAEKTSTKRITDP